MHKMPKSCRDYYPRHLPSPFLQTFASSLLRWVANNTSPIIVYPCYSLTHWLPHYVQFSKLNWCDPGVWRWQLKTCWGYYCCWCWGWGVRIMLATVLKLNFCWDFEHKGWSRFWSWSSRCWSWSLFSILPLMFCRPYEVESWSRFWS